MSLWSLSCALALLGLVSCSGALVEDELDTVEQLSFAGDLGTALGTPLASGTTVGRSNDFMPACRTSTAPDAAYLWTAPAAGTYEFSTSGSAFDTVLEVRRYNTGAVLGCNDNSNGTSHATVKLALASGQTVMVIVDGAGAAQGDYQLHIHQSLAIPAIGLQLWLRADEGVSTTNGVVMQWLDQSGKARHARSYREDVRSVVPGALAGRPVIRFAGDSPMSFPAVSSTAFTVFVVGKANGPALQLVLSPDFVAWEQPDVIVDPPLAGPVTVLPFGDTSAYHALSVRYDGATLAAYRNGLLRSSRGLLGAPPWQFYWIGWVHLDADLAEIIVYDRALTEPERAAVSDYLQRRHFPVVCGDGTCEGDENLLTCPEDCSVCGDGVCAYPETPSTCAVDCPPIVCGDGVCGRSESPSTCPIDCVECAWSHLGGDGPEEPHCH